MKQLLLIVSALACTLAFGKDRNAYMEYRDYPVPAEKCAATPKGFVPVYLSHYGRHGARYYHRQEGYDSLKVFFEDAIAAKVLTTEGHSLAQKYLSAYPHFALRAGDLTAKGQAQHKGIARRMYREYKSVFRRKPLLIAHASMTQRAILSMVAFCDELESLGRRLQIEKEASSAFLPALNPHHSSLAYAAIAKTGEKPYGHPWEEETELLRDSLVRPDAFLEKYFTDIAWTEHNFGTRQLELMLYYLMLSTECTEIPYHFTELFTPEELDRISEWNNLNYYCKWGPGPARSNPAYPIAAYLLEELITDTEQDLAEGKLGGRLRFGHDAPMAMLLALMDAEGWGQGVSHPAEVKDVYDFSNIPMAANLQLILYQNRKGERLLRMMLNEKDLKLPLPGGTDPFYRWEDFAAHYRGVIAAANSRMNQRLSAEKQGIQWTHEKTGR